MAKSKSAYSVAGKKEKLEQEVIVMITTHQDFSEKNIFNTNTLNMEDFNVRSN